MNEVLANPKLEAHAPGGCWPQYELGKLYSGRLHQPEKAADAFAKVLDALDDKSANRLSPANQVRILGNDPSTAYLNFGLVFLVGKRYELAVKALERGLIYDEDNPQISLLLAETLLKLNKGDQALALVDRQIERQTPFVEAYELLAKVLKATQARKGDHASAGSGRPARFQERSAPVRSGRSLSRDGRDRQGRGALQSALYLAADAPDLPGSGDFALEAEEGRRLAQGDQRGVERPESQEAIKPQLAGRRRR